MLSGRVHRSFSEVGHLRNVETQVAKQRVPVRTLLDPEYMYRQPPKRRSSSVISEVQVECLVGVGVWSRDL